MNKYLIKSLAFLLMIGGSLLVCFAQTPAPTPYPKPSNPLFNEKQLGDPGLLKAWGYTIGSANVKIAILSTGADSAHPEIKDSLQLGYNSFDDSTDIVDKMGVGTYQAGLIVSPLKSLRGTAGIAPGVKFIPVKVLNDQGYSTPAGVAKGVRWAVDNGANILLMAFSGQKDSKEFKEAFEYANSKGVLMVVTDKDQSGAIGYPALYGLSNMIIVGTTDNLGKIIVAFPYKVGDSKYVSIAAAGVRVKSTLPMYANNLGQKEYGELSGGLVSATIVAGAVALAKSLKPNITNAVIKEKLCSTATASDIYKDKISCGMINIGKFIEAIAALP